MQEEANIAKKKEHKGKKQHGKQIIRKWQSQIGQEIKITKNKVAHILRPRAVVWESKTQPMLHKPDTSRHKYEFQNPEDVGHTVKQGRDRL